MSAPILLGGGFIAFGDITPSDAAAESMTFEVVSLIASGLSIRGYSVGRTRHGRSGSMRVRCQLSDESGVELSLASDNGNNYILIGFGYTKERTVAGRRRLQSDWRHLCSAIGDIQGLREHGMTMKWLGAAEIDEYEHQRLSRGKV